MSQVELSRKSLAKVGVSLIYAPQEIGKVMLQCKKCGQLWTPYDKRKGQKKRGQQLLPGWWKCPSNCNASKPLT